MHIGGALERQRAGCASCTSRRSWRRRSDPPAGARARGPGAGAAPAAAGEPDATAPAYDVALSGSEQGRHWSGRETISFRTRARCRSTGSGSGSGATAATAAAAAPVRIADVAGARAGAARVFCSAIPLQLDAPLAPGARGSVSFDVDIRAPRPARALRPARADGVVLQRDPRAGAPRGRRFRLDRYFPFGEAWTYPAADWHVSSMRRAGSPSPRPGCAGRRQPPARARPRLLVRRRRAAVGPGRHRRRRGDGLGRGAAGARRNLAGGAADRAPAAAAAGGAVRTVRLARSADRRHARRRDGAHRPDHDAAGRLHRDPRAGARVVVRADLRRPGGGALARRGVRLLRRGGRGRAAAAVVPPAASRRSPRHARHGVLPQPRATTATARSTPRARACSTCCASAWAAPSSSAALRDYALANRYGWSTAAEFRAAMDAVSPVPLDDLWRRYRVPERETRLLSRPSSAPGGAGAPCSAARRRGARARCRPRSRSWPRARRRAARPRAARRRGSRPPRASRARSARRGRSAPTSAGVELEHAVDPQHVRDEVVGEQASARRHRPPARCPAGAGRRRRAGRA